MKFIDEVTISVQSGNGGPGAVSFRREKFVPRGGPDGGDGGAGGDVIFYVNPQLNSLLSFHYKRNYAGGNGQAGGAMNMTGADGEDIILEVPPGTLVRSEDGTILLDLSEAESRHTFLSGGRGGKGNHFFKTSVNQAPTHAQPGERGERLQIKLELKLMADVGIIGYPNAGKSTLISKLSAAKPKIADYPFTTLSPSLGIVQIADEKTLVLADIPGLIPGAHQGVGLGIKFLRHIERTRCFIHLIDASGLSGRDPLQDYDDIVEELTSYDRITEEQGEPSRLQERKQVVVLNKIESLTEGERRAVESKFRERGVVTRGASALTGMGLKELKFELEKLVFQNGIN